jgi:thermitase
MKRIVVTVKNIDFNSKSNQFKIDSKNVSLTKTFDMESQFESFSKNIDAKGAKNRIKFFESLSPEEQLLDRVYHLDVADKDAEKILASLAKDPNIETVKLDLLNQLYFIPNDPLLANLWAMPKIKAQQAWDISTGSNIIVAVCDTGVDRNHPDLMNNIWTNNLNQFGYDFSDNDTNPADYHGHGTHVAGTIAASGNNALGVVGVGFNVKIMSVKIFPNAWNSVCANAIKWAADNGASLINCSWGPATMASVSPDPILKAAIDYAYQKKCYCVFAAGNNNIDCSTQFPANYTKVITVGATDQNDQKAPFSNYGNVVDISAPGVGILSTQMNGGYLQLQGTSMAAPHVAGGAALLLSLAPRLGFDNILYFLKKSADTISTSQPTINKRLNCFRLVQPAQQIFKRQTQVDNQYGRFALQVNNNLAHMQWTGSNWVQNLIGVWGGAIVNGSLEKYSTSQVIAVNAKGNLVVTYGNLPNLSIGVVAETFGIIPGTLRYSKVKDAIYAINVFHDFVYIKWLNQTCYMDIITNWGGQIALESFSLYDTEDGIMGINTSGVSCHSWTDPNGQTLIDGTKIGISVHSNLNGLIF